MSKIAGMQYSVGSPTRQCAGTGRPIATGEHFVAALTQSLETEDFVRVDYSEQAWESGARPRRPLALLGFWRAVASEGGAKKRLLIDDDALVELFEQTGEPVGEVGAGTVLDGERERMVFRFVLALILLRKRLLVQEGSKGGTMLVRERGVAKPPEGPPLIEVVDPGMDETAIVGVTAQLAAVLAGDDVASTQSPAGGAA